MLNQFLFNDNPKIEEIKKFTPVEIDINIENIKETNKYLLKSTIQGDNEKSANLLDTFQDKILEQYPDTIVLSSESSKYYNRRLYPLVNDMERNLRNLLYLANTLMDKEYEGIIKDLEEMDFGGLYRFLFTDTDFMDFARNIFKKGKTDSFNSNLFSKSDLISFLQKQKESVLWDKVLNDKAVPTFRNNFTEIRDYRNSVMHAHNINQKCYRKAKKLYEDVNKELEEEIKNIETSPVSEINENISEIMSATLASLNAIKQANIALNLSEALVTLSKSSQLTEVSKILSNLSTTSGMAEVAEILKNTLESIQFPKIDIDTNFADKEDDDSDEDIDELEDNEDKET